MNKRILASIALVALLALGAGCGGPQDQAANDGDASQVSASNQNDADQNDANQNNEKETAPKESDAKQGGDGKPLEPAPETNPTPAGGTPDATQPDATQPDAAQPGGSNDKPTAGVLGQLDTAFISDDFAAAAVLHPRQILTSKLVATVQSLPLLKKPGMLPREANDILDPQSQGNKVALGIEQMIVLAAPVDQPPHVLPSAIVRFNNAEARQAFTEQVGSLEQRTHNGKTYYVRPDDQRPRGLLEFNAAYIADDKTFVISFEPLITKMIDAQDVKTPLTDRLAKLEPGYDVAVVAQLDQLQSAMQMGTGMVRDELTSKSGPLVNALEGNLQAVTLRATLDADPVATLQLQARDGAGAETINKEAATLLGVGKETFNLFADAIVAKDAAYKPLIEMAGRFVDGVSLQQQDKQVVVALPGVADDLNQLPEALKPLEAITAKLERMNRMRQVVLGLQNAHDQLGEFALNIPGKDGTPQLSWRVALLPFVERQNLWQQFDRAQPWDSPQNKPLLEQMPEIYQPVTGEVKPGHTVYLMFQGAGTLLDGKRKSFASIVDGTSATLAVIEVSPERAVPWTKPQDIDFEAENLLEALGPPPSKEGYTAGFLDGHVEVIPPTIELEKLKQMIRINDAGA